MSGSSNPLKWRSTALTDGPTRAGARAMLRATGLTDDDLGRPLIGVANTWIEIGPCNYHLRELAAHVKDGVRAAGGTPLEFNTISISDGITMGTEGMRASLISREVIADSIELVARGHLFDGARRPGRLRQDHPGGGHGAGAAGSCPAWCSTAARLRPGAATARTSPSRTSSRRSARTRRAG